MEKLLIRPQVSSGRFCIAKNPPKPEVRHLVEHSLGDSHGALAPIANYFTPFLDPTNNSYWTPDIFWRLVLYYHGAFIPWMMVLASLVIITFHLDSMKGKLGGHLQHLVLIGGLFSGPLAALGGIFDVYQRFAFGIPAWTQIVSIGIGGETVAFLIFSMLYFPKASNKKYTDLGLPYFVVLLSIVGVLIAALMGDLSGWITWFGPWPSILPRIHQRRPCTPS